MFDVFFVCCLSFLRDNGDDGLTLSADKAWGQQAKNDLRETSESASQSVIMIHDAYDSSCEYQHYKFD